MFFTPQNSIRNDEYKMCLLDYFTATTHTYTD